MKILVAMSGGVDSSTIAHLLKQEGHELIGVMMKLWMDPLAPVIQRAIPTKCCSVEHIQRARSVCEDLDIPFYVMNLEEEFKEYVVDPFLESYKRGSTPNPCVACNRHIKFGMLVKKAEELGCEKIATGHYAQVKKDTAGYHLLQAIDEDKDQSYYLYSLSQNILSKVLFPLGGMHKQDVFALAKKFKVSIPESYRESQDLCFFPEKEPSAFLKRYLHDVEEGDIQTEDGEVVGTHKGLPYYTIGQRRGLGVGGLTIPLHVKRKEPATNTIIVAPDGEDCSTSLIVEGLRWLCLEPTEMNLQLEARINSLGDKTIGTLDLTSNIPAFTFNKPVRGIADDQAIVFYKEEEVVGGGMIRRID